MRTINIYAGIFLLSLPLAGCGYSVFDAAEDAQGNSFDGGKAITSVANTTDAFTAIEAFGPDTIILVSGDTFSIRAEGNAEALKTLRYKIDGNAIQIGRTKGRWFGDGAKAVTITITAPKVSKLSLAGSGDFKGDRLSGDTVSIDIAGSGTAQIDTIEAQTIDGNIAGSGDIKAGGKAANAEWSVAGSGNVDAASLVSETVKISVAGSGDVRASASKTADASIAGSGDITVSGGAKCTQSIIGSGAVNCS